MAAGSRQGPGVAEVPVMVDEATSTSGVPYYPALDGIRALAVAAVLLFHGGHLTGGYLGVDAFFVLSGFLITSLLLAERVRSGRTSLVSFWTRRVRRLLPALVLVLLAVAAYAYVVADPSELRTIRHDTIATIFYGANWREVFVGNDYFAMFRRPSPLQHTWSLAIEEQFYLVFPLLLVALARTAKPTGLARRVFLAAAVLGAASVVCAQLLYRPSDPSRVYFGTDTRVASILIGVMLACAIAMWGHVRSDRAVRHLHLAAGVAVVGLAGAWSLLPGGSRWLYRGGLLACALAVALVIAVAVHPKQGPLARALSWRPLVALGIISYGVYLWHWPIYVLLDHNRTHLRGWTLLTIRVAATLVVAVASFRLVERPIRHSTRPLRWKGAWVPATAVAVVVVVLVSTIGAPPPAKALERFHQTASTGPSVLLFGDSITRLSWTATDRALGSDYKLATGAYIGDTDRAVSIMRSYVRRFEPEAVIVELGTDEALYGRAGWRRGFEGMRTAVAGVPCVGVVTVSGLMDLFAAVNGRANFDIATKWNAALAEYAKSDPRVHIIDWSSVGPIPAYTYDGTHATALGRAWLVRNYREFLEQGCGLQPQAAGRRGAGR